MNNMHSEHLDITLFHHLDMNLYPLFIAIFEQKSISQAAQLLCISQSAASHALQRLRRQLHDDLFLRSGSQMLATPFAQQVYPVIKHALQMLQGINQQQHYFDPQSIQQLKIAVHDEIEPMLFPKLVQHFRQLGLNIQLQSFKLNRKTLAQELKRQQIDFAIDLEQNLNDQIGFQALVEDRFVLCSQQSSLSREHYLAAKHIGVSSRRSGMLLEDFYLQQQHLSRQIFLRCQHYSTALHILNDQADLVLTIPKNVLHHLAIPQSLTVSDLPMLLPKMKLGIFWHQDLNQNLRHQFLKQQITDIFA